VLRVLSFFCEQCNIQSEQMAERAKNEGHGVGYYVCAEHDKKQGGQYIAGGYSLPVMSYVGDSEIYQVCPSIDITKLKQLDDWQQILNEKISSDMFIYFRADNNFDDFEKIVQIVLNKGYTILKVDEML